MAGLEFTARKNRMGQPAPKWFHVRLGPCHCGHPGAGCDCYEERRARAEELERKLTNES